MSYEDVSAKVGALMQQYPQVADIQRISLFGSYAKGSADDDSDIDLLVEFLPDSQIGFFELNELKTTMEAYLNKPVDILTPDAVSKHLEDEIFGNSKVVYEKQ